MAQTGTLPMDVHKAENFGFRERFTQCLFPKDGQNFNRALLGANEIFAIYFLPVEMEMETW